VISVEVRSSERVRAFGYVTGCLWMAQPSYKAPSKIDGGEEVLRLQAPLDGVAITIRLHP
jgi:hypothetical protein